MDFPITDMTMTARLLTNVLNWPDAAARLLYAILINLRGFNKRHLMTVFDESGNCNEVASPAGPRASVLELDDTQLREHLVYPKDLVDLHTASEFMRNASQPSQDVDGMTGAIGELHANHRSAPSTSSPHSRLCCRSILDARVRCIDLLQF